jgi:rhodanese-related sulfurtransferase
MRLLETSSERPIIIDVRDGATYAKSPVRIPESRHITPHELETGVTALKIEPTRVVIAYCT